MVFFCPASSTEKTESQATQPLRGACSSGRRLLDGSSVLQSFCHLGTSCRANRDVSRLGCRRVVGCISACNDHCGHRLRLHSCLAFSQPPSAQTPSPRFQDEHTTSVQAPPLPVCSTPFSWHRLHFSPSFLLFHSRPDSLEQVLRLGNTRLASVRAYRRRNTHLATETRSVILDRDDPSSSKTPIPALPPGLDRRPTTCTKDRRLDDLRSDNPPPGVNAICA